MAHQRSQLRKLSEPDQPRLMAETILNAFDDPDEVREFRTQVCRICRKQMRLCISFDSKALAVEESARELP
jgi:hypothetical protein